MGDLAANVKSWLAAEGYPLEMRTARTLSKTTTSLVSPSQYYTDPDTGKACEIDIHAGWGYKIDRKTRIGISCAIECKSSTESPWVLFLSHKKLSKRALIQDRLATSAGAQWLKELAENHIDEISQLPLFAGDGVHAYGMTTALSQKKDNSYGALMNAVKAAAHTARIMSEMKHFLVYAISFPVIVFSGRLFQASLNEQADVEVAEITHGRILTGHPASGKSRAIVDIVTEDQFPQFARDMEVTVQSLFKKDDRARRLGL
ncbi:hypothetical protein [Microbispora triticiradicis]|uniref:DUF4365 domain-containing protein n=2 Tax=Microbispora TaxID=2005 RepID=A0ABY3M6E2_9ACTN|nr:MULTISPECIES: hypothetical protein [Microbispora]TLP66460.1 hypothetical protein FED44_03040 [Microbispora fusca]TYB68244.1 hypothetical protein FXF59_01780 [Microbispora tritici]